MYITQSTCISPQKTFNEAFLEGEIQPHTGIRYHALEPDYGKLIPASLLRRMGKAIRMGVGTGLPLLQNQEVDGIIIGTANGGLEDCLKFLNQIVDYNEGTLTPTNFVQSTPNAVAGNLALMSKITGYNTTHVHRGLAFEAALLDGLMLLQEKRAAKLLIGSVDEISDYNHNIDTLSGAFKSEETNSEMLLKTNTPGSVNGEGAVMFLVSAEADIEQTPRIIDLDQSSYLPESGLEGKLRQFLAKNELLPEHIDALIFGISGDSQTDYLYTNLLQNVFAETNCYSYKNLTGNYPTSSAFATWLATQLLLGKTLPEQCRYIYSGDREVKRVLIYNHFRGLQHGFILMGIN